LDRAGDFSGRVALVTGGTRGIGAAISRDLVARGARVHAVYRADSAAAEKLRAELGDAFSVVAADLALPDVADRIVETVVEKAGRLDVLVNCAGATDDRLLLRTRSSDLRGSLAVNLEAVVLLSRAALQPMLKQRYGRIVSVSSVVASMGNPGQTAYAAAKAGVEGFTRSLAREVASRGVTANCVAPGWIATELTAHTDDAARARALQATPLGRAGTPEEVACAVTFLASERAGYITGTVLQVNGGMYM
jgi:3-oxoacyl-[acyl-carrier protein] reductase